MSISYQFGDVDAHGALIRAQAASLEAEHQAIVRDVLAAGDFWGGSGSVACQEFITQLGRNFQVIYEQANSHGQKVQTAGNNMSSTDSAVGLQLGLTLHGRQSGWRQRTFKAPAAPALGGPAGVLLFNSTTSHTCTVS